MCLCERGCVCVCERERERERERRLNENVLVKMCLGKNVTYHHLQFVLLNLSLPIACSEAFLETNFDAFRQVEISNKF